MLRKALPYVLAAIVFFVALALIRPAPSKTVVVAAQDLKAGHVLAESDLALRSMPASAVASDALTSIQPAVGQALRIDRGAGDIIRSSNFGEMIALQPNERAIAIRVSDATGLVGLLSSNQTIGVIATIPLQGLDTQGTFSKVTVEGLRVLYVDPRFAANDSASAWQPAGTPVTGGLAGLGGITTDERSQTGYVVLAVPTDLQTIVYDFSADGAISQTRQVNALEMLAALSATSQAEITLYLMPAEQADDFASPGLFLQNLVVIPGPSSTPTITLTPTLTPAVTP